MPAKKAGTSMRYGKTGKTVRGKEAKAKTEALGRARNKGMKRRTAKARE